MKYKKDYLVGGLAGKADPTDYVVGYKTENGIYIMVDEIINTNYRSYYVDKTHQYSTLKEALRYCEQVEESKKERAYKAERCTPFYGE